MAAKYILGVLAIVFLAAAARRYGRDGGQTTVQTRTWLLVGTIFAAVSLWLFTR